MSKALLVRASCTTSIGQNYMEDDYGLKLPWSRNCRRDLLNNIAFRLGVLHRMVVVIHIFICMFWSIFNFVFLFNSPL